VHYVILGCGRVGASLAEDLSRRGHSVAIIDQNPSAFTRLPDTFEGQQITGVGFDRDTLEQAGIVGAAGFAAVSSGDNSNIIAARVVRETFGVSNVVARIYDPQRAAIYERFGVPTVPTVSWTADQVLHRLIPMPPQMLYRSSSADLGLYDVQIGTPWLGRSTAELEDALPLRAAFLVRGGEGMIPRDTTVLQKGDDLSIIAAPGDLSLIESTLAEGPAKEAE